MKGVIYARYSSDNQREESIEGQLRECKAFAEKNDIQIIDEYIDRALSAKTDHRPSFQQMIKDSAKEQFDVIIVWKLDRFARNRYDSAHYKAILKRNNVRVISATEAISQGPEGIILESLLEGMAEYYSAELAEKVIRGQTENAYKCKFNGGTIPFGFYIDDERRFQINEEQAAVVREAFKLCNEGLTLKEIAEHFNSKGIRNSWGSTFKISTISTMLSNRRYIGEYKYRDIVIENGIPAIVSKEVFEAANKRIADNKKAPAKHKVKSDDEYILTTKLYCGKCMTFMVGESGTSRQKLTYRYYKCLSAKRKSGCDKKAVKKDAIEDIVIDQIQKIILDDELINDIAETVLTVQNQSGSEIPILTKQLSEIEKSLANVMKAIEMGVVTETTKKRLIELETQKKELEFQLSAEEIKRPTLTKEQIVLWLKHFRELDPQNPKHRKRLVDTFVNAIILYDDRIEFFFNFKDSAKVLKRDDLVNGSDLFGSAPPKRNRLSAVSFLLYRKHSLPETVRDDDLIKTERGDIMQKIALIPAYCPEDRMLPLLSALRERGFHIIVVDDGSGAEYDRSFEAASEFAEVLRYTPNRGKGEALRHGLSYIREHYPSPYTVVTADADGQHRTEDIVKVSDIAADHPDALILGKRHLDQNAPLKSRIGNGLTRVFYRLCTGRRIYETQTGLRGFSDRLLPRFLKLPGHRYEYEIDMMLSASDTDVIETEIQTIYFDNNAASHFRPIEDTVSLNKEFIRYKIPSLIAGCADYALFILLAALSEMWLLPNIGARLISTALKFILNKAVFFSEKASILRLLITSVIIIAAETGLIGGLSALGMNLYAAKLLAAVLMIGVSILIRRIWMHHRHRD